MSLLLQEVLELLNGLHQKFFDADWSTYGADSPTDYARGIMSKFESAELKPYADLGRQADKTSYVCGVKALPYLKKLTAHGLWQSVNAPSKVGIFSSRYS